jgi:hypothetical protein
MGIESQVAFCLPSRPELVGGLALTRERKDFSDREVQLLGLARPHLIQAYRNAELRGTRVATLEAGLDTLGRHIVVTDAHGQMEFATDGARQLLDGSIRLRSGLPAEVDAGVSAQRGPRPAAAPYLLQTQAGGVLVRLLPSTREDRRQVLLLEGAPGELNVAALRGLGLTPSQAQTAAPGRAWPLPRATATKMGIARRTVDKHLQQIYAKLGTPSRAQAAATAWAAVGVERPPGLD